MFGSVLVDVTIGVVLLYLLVALFCTAIQEWIAQLLDTRAKHLQAAIAVLIGGNATPDPLAKQVLEHPLVRLLAVVPGQRKGPKDPAYLPARNFSDALVSKLIPAGQALDLKNLANAVSGIANNPGLKDALTAIVQRATGSQATPEEQIRAAMNGIETWFDSAMGHATGWYKRKVRGWLLIIAAVLTVALNADSIQVGMLLSTDAQLRQNVAAYAATIAPVNKDQAEQIVHWRVGRQRLRLPKPVVGPLS